VTGRREATEAAGDSTINLIIRMSRIILSTESPFVRD